MTSPTQPQHRWFLGLVCALAAVRFLTLPFAPLTDKDEARYAEIGRIMAHTGNYITPMLEDAPFWAKPPLSFWATAVSFHIFGVNNFAAHLPHFLFLMATVALLYFFVRRRQGEWASAAAATALLTMPVFLYLTGAVMTDPALTFCITLSMVSFYPAIVEKNKFWGYLFFISLALGLLAKGPIALVLVGFSIFIWTLFKNKWCILWCRLPWMTGIVLMLAITLPWYILAEHVTPGFLKYFIIGEHFERYTVPDWSGDLYGVGRGGFFGKIWVFYFLSALPWSIWFLTHTKSYGKFVRDEFLFYAVAFTLAPLIFFSLSRNVVLPYVLPALIPTAVLVAASGDSMSRKLIKWYAGVTAVLFIAVIVVQLTYPKWTADFGICDQYFISEYEAVKGEFSPLLFYKTRNYSAQFYAAAHKIQYKYVADEAQMHEYVPFSKEFFILLRQHHLKEVEHAGQEITLIASGKKMILIKVKSAYRE